MNFRCSRNFSGFAEAEINTKQTGRPYLPEVPKKAKRGRPLKSRVTSAGIF